MIPFDPSWGGQIFHKGLEEIEPGSPVWKAQNR